MVSEDMGVGNLFVDLVGSQVADGRPLEGLTNLPQLDFSQTPGGR
jgi:hypothetical protein